MNTPTVRTYLTPIQKTGITHVQHHLTYAPRNLQRDEIIENNNISNIASSSHSNNIKKLSLLLRKRERSPSPVVEEPIIEETLNLTRREANLITQLAFPAPTRRSARLQLQLEAHQEQERRIRIRSPLQITLGDLLSKKNLQNDCILCFEKIDLIERVFCDKCFNPIHSSCTESLIKNNFIFCPYCKNKDSSLLRMKKTLELLKDDQ